MEDRLPLRFLRQLSQRLRPVSLVPLKFRWALPFGALLLVAAPSFCADAPRPVNVLLLYLGDKDSPAVTVFESGLRSSMERGLNAPVWIYNESFDEGWLGQDPRYAQTMERFLKAKYGKRGIDIVVAVGNYALQYMQQRRKTLLPDARLTYACWQSPQPPVPNTTGMVWKSDLAPTVEVALTQNPGTHHVLLITGVTASDRGMVQLFLASGLKYLQEKHKEVDIQVLPPGTLAQTLSKLATLPKDTIPIFIAYYGDSAGQGFVPDRMLPIFSAIANRPLYGWADLYLGHGVVGGSLIKLEAWGETFGDLALRVVHGENPGEIPELRVDIRQNEFDWKQLKRWGIGMDKIPADSVVINREYTFWELYKWRIIGLLCLIVVEAGLIVVLIRLSVAQRRNLKQLGYQRALEALIAQVAASFITLRGELVNPDIERSLQRVIEFFDLDRISLFEFSAETARLHLLCSYTSPGVEKPPAVVDLPHDLRATSQIWKGGPIIASHLDQLPDQASIMTEILRDSGVCSLAAFPLQRKGDTFAILAFSTIRHEREWPPDVVEALQTVSHIFANALERMQAEKVLTESQNELTGIVESAMDAIIAIDGQQRVMVFNAAAEKMFGCTAEKAIGQSIEHFIPHRFRTQHAKHISGFAETGVTSRIMGALGVLSALRANGEEFPIEASISQVQRDGASFFTVVIRDITERQRAEQQLSMSNQLNASILESLRNHVAVLDSKGFILAASKREPEFVGSSGIDLLDLRVGENYFELCRAAAAGDSDVQAALAGVQSIYDRRRDYFEMEYAYKTGADQHWTLLSMTPLKGNSGIVISHQDVTERKRHEQAIQDLSGRLISAQEQERSRIARELHDDINQQVAMLAIELQQVQGVIPEDSSEARQKIQELWKKAHTLSTDIQQLSHRLHSTKLEHLGIIAALRGLCNEFSEQHKIEVDFQFRQIPPRLNSDISLSLFRVAQESLHNVEKHSRAGKVRLELIGTGGQVTMRISDDGVGFDPDASEHRAGIGIISMSERIRLVGGTLSVVSRPSLGTQVEATIPVSPITFAVGGASRSVPATNKTG